MNQEQAIHQLCSEKPAERVAAAELLAQQEPLNPAAVEPLVRATSDQDEAVREWSAAALETCQAVPAELTAQLQRHLMSDQPGPAYWAATLLGRAGAADAAAVADLAGLMMREAAPLAARERAAWALGRLGNAAAIAKPHLQLTAERAAPPLQRLARLACTALVKADQGESPESPD